MPHISRVIAAVCLLVCSVQVALAESRVALVVGNSAYVNTTPLANPLNDARDMALALKGAGFDVVEAFDADKRSIDQALRSFTDKLSQADVALFFYAGHGLQVGAQNFLVPVDAKLERERDLEFEAVKLDFVLRQMEIDREGKTSIVFLDACRDNPLSRNLARSMGTRSAGIGRGLAAAATGLGTFIAYSTQPGNVALDGDGRNSPFTSALVKQMSIKGRNLPATMIEVRKDVVAATGGRQVPWDHSALTGDFYFAPDGSATPGSAHSVAAVPNAEVAALQERLRKLEDDAKKRDAAGRAGGPGTGADILKLADLRGRAASLEELTKDLQRKFMAALTAQGRATDKEEKAKLARDSQSLQMEMARRNLDLQRLKAEMAAFEQGTAATEPAKAAALPVIPKAQAQKDSPNFDIADNVGLVGTEMRSIRAPNPVACREACEADATCAGFQHGRKSPVMGQCDLFSRVDARREDNQWRSGVRKGAAAGTAMPAAASASKIVFPAPVSRTKQGFHVYEGVLIFGDEIKSGMVDSADGCLAVCRNTPQCTAATYRHAKGSTPIDNNCVVFSNIKPTNMTSEDTTTIVRAEP